MKKLLITGASGFLGWNLCNVASRYYSVVGLWNNHPVLISSIISRKCDITDFNALKAVFREEKPDAVIHAAAASNPNYCQLHPEETHKLNVIASSNIAGLCFEFDIKCAFTSTDLVFDGSKPPYSEDDFICPVNVYGQQKAEAEKEMCLRSNKVIICRMPLMYGDAPEDANSFIQPWIKQLKSNAELSLFTDEIRTPVSAKDASKGLLLALEKLDGIVHLGGKERLSRFDMGMILLENLSNVSGKIVPCMQKDVPMAAPRPKDVSMNSTKAFAMGYCPGSFREESGKLFCVK